MQRTLAILLTVVVPIIILATPVLGAGPILYKATGGGTAVFLETDKSPLKESST